VDLSRQAKRVDFSGAEFTKPMKVGATLPQTCSVGETFFNTSAGAGSNVLVCTAANEWTVLAGAALPSPVGSSNQVLYSNGSTSAWTPLAGDVGGQPAALVVQGLRGWPLSATAPADGQYLRFDSAAGQWLPAALSGGSAAPEWPVTRTNATSLTVGTGPGVRFGASLCSVPQAPATVQLSAGTGTVWIAIRPDCELTVWHNVALSCTNCVAAAGTGFEPGSFPIARWMVTDGAFDPTGEMQLTRYAVQPLTAGENIQIAYNQGVAEVSAFTAGVNLSNGQPLTMEWDNLTSGAGTAQNRPAQWDVNVAGQSFLTVATGSTAPVAGIVVGGAGTSGKARVALTGVALCEFDGPVQALDYVTVSAAGFCTSAGATPPSGAILGRVLTTGTGSGLRPVWISNR
jgi:hypothetical protein